MEGWDLDKVKTLKAQYEAARVVTTSSYRFLDSIVHAGVPPRGRGITWLQQLLEQGPPSDIGRVLERAKHLQAEVPTADLENIIRMIQGSGRVETWQHEKIDQTEAALEKGWRPLAPEDMVILDSLFAIGAARRHWWNNRPGQARRWTLIKHELTANGRMMQADFEFITELFGPDYRELSNPSFAEGDLIRVKRRFKTDGPLLGVITAGPRVIDDGVGYEVLTGDEGIIVVQREYLLKRLK